jgi:PAS domain S-box-containing protein
VDKLKNYSKKSIRLADGIFMIKKYIEDHKTQPVNLFLFVSLFVTILSISGFYFFYRSVEVRLEAKTRESIIDVITHRSQELVGAIRTCQDMMASVNLWAMTSDATSLAEQIPHMNQLTRGATDQNTANIALGYQEIIGDRTIATQNAVLNEIRAKNEIKMAVASVSRQMSQPDIIGPFPISDGRQMLYLYQTVNTKEIHGIIDAAIDLGFVTLPVRMGDYQQEYLFAIQDNTDQIIAGDRTVFDHNPAHIDFNQYGLSWKIASAPQENWASAEAGFFKTSTTIVLFTILAFDALFYIFMLWQKKLLGALQKRSNQLETEFKERILAQDKLSHQESILYQATQRAQIGIWEQDYKSGTSYWSDELYHMLGLSPEKDLLSWEIIENYITGQDREFFKQKQTEIVQLKQTGDFELQYSLDGKVNRVIWVTYNSRLDDDGNLIALWGVAQDISNRKAAESQLLSINRFLKMILTCRQELVRVKNEKELLVNICQIIVENGNYQLCWVGEALQDADKPIGVLASSKDGSNYLQKVHLTWSDSPVGLEPSGMAIKTKQIVLSNDLQNDPNIIFKDAVKASDFHSAIVIPLELASDTNGILAIYSNQKDVFSSDEVDILTQLAADISFGLNSLRARNEYQEAAEALRVSEEKFSKVFHTSPDAIILTDLYSGEIIDVNEYYCQKTGYSREEVIGTPVTSIHLWEEEEDRENFLSAINENGELLNHETQFRMKNGFVMTGIISARTIVLNSRTICFSIIRDITENLRNERALKISEERLRLITENMMETVWLLDLDLTINYASPSVEHYLCDEGRDIIGTKITDWFDSESVNSMTSTMERIISQVNLNESKSDESEVIDVKLTTVDQSKKLFEINISLLMDVENKPLSWLCVGRDNTERKQMEDALKESEQRWQLALEGSGDGVWDWNIEKGTDFLTSHTKTMFGYDADKEWPQLKNWKSEIHPDDLDGYLQSINPHIAGKTPEYHHEYRFRCSDGSYKWIMDRGKVIERSANGSALRMVGTVTDMSERREIIKALEQSEQKFRLIAERSTDLISRHSGDGRFIYVSPSSEKILGYSPVDLIDLNFLDLVHPEDKTLVGYVINHVDKYQVIHPIQYRMRQKGDTYIWVETIANVIHDSETNDLIEFQATTRDISERVFAENAMRESEEKLRSLITQSADGIVLINEEGKIIEWSRGQEQLTGIPATEAMGEEFWKIQYSILPAEKQTPEQEQRLKHQIEEYLLNGSSSSNNMTSEEVIARDDGTQLVVQTTTFPIHTPYGYMAGAISRDITKIKQAEKALKESEERLRYITDNMVDIVSYVNEDYIIQYISPSIETTLGYSPDDLIGKSIDDLFHPDDLVTIHSQINSGIEQGIKSIRVNYRNRDIQGDYRFMESLINLTYDDNGEFKGGILGTRDVTEQRLSNDALMQSEARYRVLARNFPNGLVMLFDQDLRFSIADGIGLTQLGYTREQLEGHTIEETFPNDIVALLKPTFTSAIKGKPEITELPLRDRILQIHTIPIYDEKGNVTGGMVMTQDITDRKNAEQALSSRAQYLSMVNEITRIALETSNPKELVQQMADLLGMMFDADDCYITGWDNQNQITIPLAASGAMRETYPSIKSKEGERTLTRSVLETGKSILVDDLYHSPYISSTLANLFPSKSILAIPLIGGGQNLGAALIGFDQSHKFLEEEIVHAEQVAAQIALGMYKQKLMDEVRSYNLELEKRVAERTSDLEVKNKELETFTYSVSHDLKTPLRGIDGYSRLLLEDHTNQLDDEGKLFLNIIRQATTQMNQLIEDLLSYSRLERRSLTNDYVNLKALVNHILLERKGELDKKNIHVILDVPDLKARIDEKALEQALRNLVDNAIKFSSSNRKPVLDISLINREGKYILKVRDNGIGFDMKYHEKIFDIFQRLHLAEEYPGTGIGLALVKKAMQRLGGTSWAESTPGNGSTFYLEFPGDNAND